MKKEYVIPEVEIIKLSIEDIVTVSDLMGMLKLPGDESIDGSDFLG